MEPRWNDTDREEPKYSEKNLSHCQSVNFISLVDWPEREPGSPWRQAGDKPSEL
jgi:hypothetical protein